MPSPAFDPYPSQEKYSHAVTTDLTVHFSFQTDPPDLQIWHRIEKELYLHKSSQSAWLYVALANEDELTTEGLLVMEIKVSNIPPDSSAGRSLERRPGGTWVLRAQFSGVIDQAVTQVDVLFGTDAVDPRPQWVLMSSSPRLNGQLEVPVARLSVLRGRAEPKPDTRAALRVRGDGIFKIAQFCDTHMVTGPGLHHDIPDSQTALFKAVAPIIERSIPVSVVFGNHDSERNHALSRMAQMLILQDLPFSLCKAGPEHVDGIGNIYLEVLAPAPSQFRLSTLYFLDSHGEINSEIKNPDSDCIKPSQIRWFRETSQALRKAREDGKTDNRFHLSLVFQQIPLPEFADNHLNIHNGHRREPTEDPSSNSHFSTP
ncbi:metallo-dependent phosphatase [Fusarium mundagurra]|uniref:Metallo-dependent phosphatase n=1 Tax=Fusarium mundagurra TaxID=1567541 RepID=A0A8H5Y800_9HYPO|nr:metallo-dependent phosphatase [Fusarium mundagurra]